MQRKMIAVIPQIIPIHCLGVSFSLKRKIEVIVASVNPPPFTMGKNTALFITPERYRFITLLSAKVIPAVAKIMQIMIMNFFLEKFSVFLETEKSCCFLSMKKHINETIAETINATIKKGNNSCLKLEVWCVF